MMTFHPIPLVLGFVIALVCADSSSAAPLNDNQNSQATPIPNAAVPAKKANAAPVDNSYMMIKKEPMKSYDGSSLTNPNTEKMTIIEVVNANPSLTTLSAALKASGINQILQTGGPYTIFAPNDAAFAKLSPNTLADLLKPENKAKLTSILNYHILPGAVKAANIKTSKIKSLDGKVLDAKVDAAGAVTLNNAKVVKTDIVGTNGVIHLIDTVLLP